MANLFMQRLARLSEDGYGQPLDALGIADGVDLDDLVVADSEGHDKSRASTSGDDGARSAVDQGGKHLCGGARTEIGLPGDGCGAADHSGAAWSAGAEVGS